MPTPPATPALARLDNVVLTPHAAGSTEEALIAMAMAASGAVIDVLAGRQPRDMVDPGVWARRRLPA